MRRIFLDVGAAAGESVVFFREHHPEAEQFEIFCFEPHPDNIAFLKKIHDITLIKACVWVNNNDVEMRFGKLKSGSVYADKSTGRLSSQVTVPAIDIAEFIKENFTKDDEIWLKMNVEGAEYVVIPHLKEHNLLEWVDRMYVKWHVSKIPSVTREEHNIVEKMVPGCFNKWRCEEILPLVVV